MSEKLKITLVRSTIGRKKAQKLTVRALGLRRIGSSRIVPDNPAIRGMVAKVWHLVSVEPAADGVEKPPRRPSVVVIEKARHEEQAEASEATGSEADSEKENE